MDKYDYGYDADNEYNVDDEEDKYPQISQQAFIDIGNYMVQVWNEPRDMMDLVISELIALHECKEDNDEPTTQTMNHVGAYRQQIRSISSELFSLCSNETNDSIFNYYISDDEINVELT